MAGRDEGGDDDDEGPLFPSIHVWSNQKMEEKEEKLKTPPKTSLTKNHNARIEHMTIFSIKVLVN